MPPSAIIDASLAPWSNDVYFVAEAGALWRTDDLTTAGTATWTQIYDESDFTIGTDLEFKRIKATVVENLVYAIAVATVSGVIKAYCFRSSNSGMSWAVNEIVGGSFDGDDYTVTARSIVSAHNGTVDLSVYFERLGDAGNTYNPWALAFIIDSTDAGGWPALVEDSDTIHDYGATSLNLNTLYAAENYLMPSGDRTTAIGWLTDYFGSYTGFGGLAKNLPLDTDLDRVHMQLGHTSGDQTSTGSAWVFWKLPNRAGAAFDYARTAPNWVYVGSDDKILKSEDGGFTWEVLLDTHGAYDICVDPQVAGAVYYWSTEGNLELLVAGVPQTTLLSDSPLRQHGRIARQINGGMLWALTAGGVVKRRYLGTWTDQTSGIVDGRGLASYIGGTNAKVIFVGAVNIWYSDDAGLTWTAKQGSWGWSSPVNVHLMSAS